MTKTLYRQFAIDILNTSEPNQDSVASGHSVLIKRSRFHENSLYKLLPNFSRPSSSATGVIIQIVKGGERSKKNGKLYIIHASMEYPGLIKVFLEVDIKVQIRCSGINEWALEYFDL